MRGDTASHRHGVGLGKSCADTASPMASYPLEGQGRAFVTPLTINLPAGMRTTVKMTKIVDGVQGSAPR